MLKRGCRALDFINNKNIYLNILFFTGKQIWIEKILPQLKTLKGYNISEFTVHSLLPVENEKCDKKENIISDSILIIDMILLGCCIKFS